MSPDDVKRIVRAQAGDVQAFEQLLRALEPQLRGYINRLVSARPIAEDILQETFLRMWRGLSWLRDTTLFRPWAYRIATNEAHRVMGRESMREQTRADACELDSLQANFTDPARKLEAERCLAQVSPLARIVLVAHYYEELSLEEVSAVTGVPLGTVKSRLASGLTQLRTLMGRS